MTGRSSTSFGSFVIAVVIAITLSGCDVRIGDASGVFTPENKGLLTVMTQPLPTAGFWEGSASHPTGGFEYGLAEEIADRLDLDGVKIETENFSSIVSGDIGDADIAMALLTPTPGREQVLDFTTPYIQSPPVLLVRDGTDIPDVRTAQAMRFAVGRNTTFEDIVTDDIQPDEAPVAFENRTREIAALADGKVDVAMFDLPAAQAIVQEDDRLAIAARLSETEPIAAALPKGSDNVEAVGSALRAMDADGTIDDLSEEWLGRSITDLSNSVPLLRINP